MASFGPLPTAAAPIGVAALTLAGLSAGVGRGLCGGDSGELGASACVLGVAHPPGYPLYTLLLQAAQLTLPVGSVAQRHAIVSVLAMAAAAGLLAAWVQMRTRSSAAAWSAALLFAGTPLAVEWGACAEVFAPHVLWLVALLCASERWLHRGSAQWAAVGAVLFGIGLAHHQTFLFLATPLALAGLMSARRRWPERYSARAVLALVGLAVVTWATVHLYLPMASAANPPVGWGEPHSLEGFLRHLLRRDYGTFQLAADGGKGAGSQVVGAFFGHILRPWWGMVALASTVGIVVSLRSANERPIALGMLAGLFVHTWAFAALGNLDPSNALLESVLARFWLGPSLFVYAFAGRGFAALALLLAPDLSRSGGGRVRSAIAVATCVAIGVMVPAGMVRSAARDSWVERAAQALLTPLPPGALVATRGDLLSAPLMFASRCERVRSDLAWVDQELLTYRFGVRAASRALPQLRFPASRYFPGKPDGFSLEQLWSAQARATPLAVYPEVKTGDVSLRDRPAPTPCGLASIYADVVPSEPLAIFLLHRAEGIPLARAGDLAVIAEGSWAKMAAEELWNARHNAVGAALAHIPAHPEATTLALKAALLLEELIATRAKAPHSVYRNLAIAWHHAGPNDPALQAKAKSALTEAVQRAPASDPDLPMLRQILEAMP